MMPATYDIRFEFRREYFDYLSLGKVFGSDVDVWFRELGQLELCRGRNIIELIFQRQKVPGSPA